MAIPTSNEKTETKSPMQLLSAAATRLVNEYADKHVLHELGVALGAIADGEAAHDAERAAHDAERAARNAVVGNAPAAPPSAAVASAPSSAPVAPATTTPTTPTPSASSTPAAPAVHGGGTVGSAQ